MSLVEFFAGFGEGECCKTSFMSLPSLTLALLTSLLIVGCATKEPNPSPSTQAALEKKDTREYNKEVEGRVP